MPQVLCLLEHAADKINGISFTLHKIDGQPAGMISEEITEGQAEHFAKIPGYELVVEADEPAAAPAAPAPAPKPEPAPAAPKAPTKAEKAAAAAKAAEEKEAADKAAADAKEADEKAAADKAAAEKKDDTEAGDKPAEEVF